MASTDLNTPETDCPEFSIITWVNKPELYDQLVKSCSRLNCEFLPMGQEFKNMSAAYNAATDIAKGRFLVYCHQDIEIIDTEFASKVRHVFDTHRDIGFLGVIGSVANHHKRLWFNESGDDARGWILQGNALTGHHAYNGMVRLLDGLIMITEKRFDFPEFLPGIHCVDSFMCLKAETDGYRNWVAPIVIRHWSEGDVHSPQIDQNQEKMVRYIAQNYRDLHPDQPLDPEQAFLYAEGLKDCDGRDLTVIIPVLNQIEHTRECLQTLRADVPRAHVIVIDNNSTDSTPEVIREEFPWVTYVRNTINAGVSASWNQGICMADTPLVCVLNNDTVIPRRGMRLLIREARRNGAATALGRRLNSNFTCGPHTEDPERMHYPEAYALVMTKQTYRKVGPFDERFWPAYSEDADYGIRLKIAGIHCAIVPMAVFHKGSVTARNLDNVSSFVAENMKKLSLKWQDNPEVQRILRH